MLFGILLSFTLSPYDAKAEKVKVDVENGILDSWQDF
jgi:hypothetical protein